MLSPRRKRALFFAVLIGLIPEILTARAALVTHFPSSILYAALHRDFEVFWTAADLLRHHAISTIFHPGAFQAWLDRRFTFSRGVRLWSYPPSTLLLVSPLGWLQPFAAWCVWTIIGAAALLSALRLSTPKTSFRAAVLLAATMPVFWDNILVGQNAAFTGALTIVGFSLIDKKPVSSGISFGLLTIKPQLGLLVPLAIFASGRWRAFAAAALTTVLLAVLSAVLFPHAWPMFFAHVVPAMNYRLTRHYVPTPSQGYMSSAFIAARGLHLPKGVSWSIQIVVSALAAGAMVALWRRRLVSSLARQRRIVASAALCLAATPFALDYDAVGATTLLAGLLMTQGDLLTRERFEIALLAIAQPGWSLILALVLHTPVFPWATWLLFGCMEALRPARDADRGAPDFLI